MTLREQIEEGERVGRIGERNREAGAPCPGCDGYGFDHEPGCLFEPRCRDCRAVLRYMPGDGERAWWLARELDGPLRSICYRDAREDGSTFLVEHRP